jgi:Fe-S-cluster containining protein
MTDGRDRFQRTACACADCVQCCREQPGPLAPGDLQRIAGHLERPVREVLAKFWASPGALVRNSVTGQKRMIGTITPRLQHGRCVFLDGADRCTVHAVAPFGCAYADTHMPEAEWLPRAQWLYLGIEEDADYQSLRRTLAPATSWRPRTGRSE